eukprot:1162016-Pelagomonas_calceolata.AAC.9
MVLALCHNHTALHRSHQFSSLHRKGVSQQDSSQGFRRRVVLRRSGSCMPAFAATLRAKKACGLRLIPPCPCPCTQGGGA